MCAVGCSRLALVLLCWHFVGADLISSTFYIYIFNLYIFYVYIYIGFPGCKGLFLYRNLRDLDVF